MKNFIIAFIVFLVWSFFGLWFYYWLQPNNNGLQGNSPIIEKNDSLANSDERNVLPNYDNENLPKVEENATDISKMNPQSNHLQGFTDDGELLFDYVEPIRITKNSANLYIPPNTAKFKYNLNAYLLENPETELHITSVYSPSENIETPNFGMKRGNKVKGLLTSIGIPAERIVVKPRIIPIEFSNENTYDKAFSFFIRPLDVARMEAAINELPINTTLYPRFSDTGILKSPALENTLDEIKNILENQPGLKITIIGHTDNVGNANDNYRKGLEMARQVRWYFIAKGGMNRQQVRAISKGESEPIDTNRTERGRDANQRIEIQYSNE